MKIAVDRLRDQGGNLIFNIRVSDVHQSPFQESDLEAMRHLSHCKKMMQSLSESGDKMIGDLGNEIHAVQEKIFRRVRDNLVFAIENELLTKFKPICQEIYNDIYDCQAPELRSWMQDFDPCRERYYFDNDRTVESDYDEE